MYVYIIICIYYYWAYNICIIYIYIIYIYNYIYSFERQFCLHHSRTNENQCIISKFEFFLLELPKLGHSYVAGAPVLVPCQPEILFLAPHHTLHHNGYQLGLHLPFGNWLLPYSVSASGAGQGIFSGPTTFWPHVSPSMSHGKEECHGKSDCSG